MGINRRGDPVEVASCGLALSEAEWLLARGTGAKACGCLIDSSGVSPETGIQIAQTREQTERAAGRWARHIIRQEDAP